MPAPAAVACLASGPSRMEERGWLRTAGLSAAVPHGPVVETERSFTILNPVRPVRLSPAGARDDRRDARVLRTDRRFFRRPGVAREWTAEDGRAAGEPPAAVALPVPQAGWRLGSTTCGNSRRSRPTPAAFAGRLSNVFSCAVRSVSEAVVARASGRGGNDPLSSMSRASSKLLTRRQLVKVQIDRLTAGRRHGRTRHGSVTWKPRGRLSSPRCLTVRQERLRPASPLASVSRTHAAQPCNTMRSATRCASRSWTRARPGARRRSPPRGAP